MESGPKFVDTKDDYAVLLGQSGWCLQERTDLTAAYLESMRTELDGMHARADALAQVFGSGEFTERMKRQQAATAAIDSGYVRRELFLARPADEDSARRRVT
jgi:hypothetical protein